MASAWIAILSMLLLEFVKGTKLEIDRTLCAEVYSSTTVVALGSPVSATCIIRADCPVVNGQDVQVVWKLNQRNVSSSLVAFNKGDGTAAAARKSVWNSTVIIPSFTDTRGVLTCSVHRASFCQIVGGVEIRAGFPPPVPQSLSCLTNLTKPETLFCQWDPGQDTSLPTNYSLHTEIRDLPESNTYMLLPGIHHYRIPRAGFVFFSDIEIYVKAVNALGQATSKLLLLEPLCSAKFDPPKVLKLQAEPNRYGCLKITWSLSEQQSWVTSVRLEIQLNTSNNHQWSEEVPVLRPARRKPVEVCRLLHGTDYQVKIRVRYNQSQWSEWSNKKTGVTLEKAPTGRLNSWLKVFGEPRQNNLSVHLFWKESKQFRANGKNLSYIVSVKKQADERGQLCVTRDSHCAFSLHKGLWKIFLTPKNAAGTSIHPTEVQVNQRRDLPSVTDISVFPHGERSLLVQWTGVESSSIMSYVVEWRPLWKMDPSLILFDDVNRSESKTVISGIELYKPYRISVYPKYKDGIGIPLKLMAYSSQKAPSAAPNLTVSENKPSCIELAWEEIPLPQRNGIIQSYQIFYWDEQGNGKVVNADVEQRRAVLEDLMPASSYKAFIMVSTGGGSLNGSEVILKTQPRDPLAIILTVIACVVGMVLVTIISFQTCYSTRLKISVWPMIPDPSNSSIKRWTMSDSMQDIPHVQDIQEPSPVYLSHLSFLDLTKYNAEKGGEINDDPWFRSSDTSDLGESVCGSPQVLNPSYTGSNQDSVPYATVVFDSLYSSQPPSQSHAYLRSESTQPLLEEELEVPCSPKVYQNVHVHREQVFFEECQDDGTGKREMSTLWDDFPMLRALEMNDCESET